MNANLSPAEILARLPNDERALYVETLSHELRAHLAYFWPFWARPNQLAPVGDWMTWLILAGRGYGKSEAGARWIRQRWKAGASVIALIAETQKDLEEVMVPRILGVHPEHERPKVRYKPVRIEWDNGAVAYGYNGTEPDQLRGPEFDTAWIDELAKYRYAQEVWDMLQFTMRSVNPSLTPQVAVTTTPRPIPIIRKLVAESKKDNPKVVVTRGSTFENASNLAKTYLDSIREKYEGTRLGRQELEAEILDDLVGALWTRDNIDKNRVKEAPEMVRIVVAIDPSGARNENDEGADDIGIIVAGKGIDGEGYILEDGSCKLSPAGWGRVAVNLYHKWQANCIIAERNFGGAMVDHVITTTDKNVPFMEVTASRGKVVRAEPVAALYEQHKIHHVGSFAALEDQMCLFGPNGFIGEGSPDRTDAAVWAITKLFLDANMSYTLADMRRAVS